MIFEMLPTLPLPWEVFRNLWILLPLVPLAGVLLMLICQFFLPGEQSSSVLHVTICAQLLLGVLLLAAARTLGPEAREIPLSVWDYPIILRVDRVKLIYLGILLVPLFLALPKYAHLNNPYLRAIFLFFLAGCSGVIVTGDIFNLFVFYELMIMAAYVLVAAKQNFAEAIKYMMFGSISSIAFLGGIIVLYAGGAPFNMQAETFAAIPPANAWWAMTLFTLAFGVKSAFFPIALAPCHAAAGSFLSAFLASFTIFTGMLGLHYLVLQPALLLGMPAFISLIRALSIVTIAMSSLILFWEPGYDRAVAQSTIVAIGFTGLLLATGAGEYAFLYVLVHALYKCLLFMLDDDCRQPTRGTLQAASPLVFLMLGSGAFLAAGLSPGLPAYFKDAAGADAWWLQIILLLSSFCIIGGFSKFRFVLDPETARQTARWRSFVLYACFTAMLGLFYLQLGPPNSKPATLLPEIAVLAAALIFGRRLYRALPRLVSMDRHWIYGQLNRQLFYIILLFGFILIWLWNTVAPQRLRS